MSYLDTYRAMSAGLTRGIRWAKGYYGQRLFGTLGLVSDMIAEGCREAFLTGLPGHPECPPDAIDQIGSDRGLFRYRAESALQWATRVSNAWTSYLSAGTSVGVLNELNYWGAVTFPFSWIPDVPSGAVLLLFESGWARFRLWIPVGFTPWTVAPNYGGGSTYGTTTLYGIGGALLDDIQTFRRIARKWKPMRSKADAVFMVSGHIYGQPLTTYGGGFNYGPAATLTTSI